MKIICICGRSGSGKDTVIKRIFETRNGDVERLVYYTTRDMRNGEVNGQHYWFVSDDDYIRMETEGKIIERREYQKVTGLVRYFTSVEGLDDKGIYIASASLGQVSNYIDYFGENSVYVVSLEVPDETLLLRGIERSKDDGESLREVCRRFISDSDEWADRYEKYKKIKHLKVIENMVLWKTVFEVNRYIDWAVFGKVE